MPDKCISDGELNIFLIKIFLLCIQTKMLMDDCSDDSDCGTNYDSGKGGSYLDVYKLSKSISMIVCIKNQ